MSVSLDTLVDHLRALPDETFNKVVDGYLRGGAEPATVEALRGPLLERVLNQLRSMARSATSQMEAKDAELTALAADLRLGRVTQQAVDEQTSAAMKWRASAVRFRERIEAALVEHQRLLHQTTPRVEELELAIAWHRNARLSTGHDAVVDADRRLWAVLGDDA